MLKSDWKMRLQLQLQQVREIDALHLSIIQESEVNTYQFVSA